MELSKGRAFSGGPRDLMPENATRAILCMTGQHDSYLKLYEYRNGPNNLKIYVIPAQTFRRNGLGVYWFANGDVYEGHWINGKRHGQGWFQTTCTF